jgi:hypothetical protein
MKPTLQTIKLVLPNPDCDLQNLELILRIMKPALPNLDCDLQNQETIFRIRGSALQPAASWTFYCAIGGIRLFFVDRFQTVWYYLRMAGVLAVLR